MSEVSNLAKYHPSTPGNDDCLALLPQNMEHDEYREFIPIARAIVHKYLKDSEEIRDETHNTDLWSVAEDVLRANIAEAVASQVVLLRDALAEKEAALRDVESERDHWRKMFEKRLGLQIAAEAREAALRKALEEARENIEHWGAYAGEYFQTKHGLADDLAAIDAALSSPPSMETSE